MNARLPRELENERIDFVGISEKRNSESYHSIGLSVFEAS